MKRARHEGIGAALPVALCALLTLLLPSVAHADGVDVGGFWTKVGGWDRSPGFALTLAVGLMLLNYGLNVAVIGVPAARAGQRPLASLGIDMIWYTVLAQAVDRFACVFALILGLSLAPLFRVGDGEAELGLGFTLGLVLNFLFSGLGVALLARTIMRRRWNTPPVAARAIAIRAGLYTNPAWAIGVTMLVERFPRRGSQSSACRSRGPPSRAEGVGVHAQSGSLAP